MYSLGRLLLLFCLVLAIRSADNTTTTTITFGPGSRDFIPHSKQNVDVVYGGYIQFACMPNETILFYEVNHDDFDACRNGSNSRIIGNCTPSRLWRMNIAERFTVRLYHIIGIYYDQEATLETCNKLGQIILDVLPANSTSTEVPSTSLPEENSPTMAPTRRTNVQLRTASTTTGRLFDQEAAEIEANRTSTTTTRFLSTIETSPATRTTSATSQSAGSTTSSTSRRTVGLNGTSILSPSRWEIAGASRHREYEEKSDEYEQHIEGPEMVSYHRLPPRLAPNSWRPVGPEELYIEADNPSLGSYLHIWPLFLPLLAIFLR